MSRKKIRFEFANIAEWPPRPTSGAARRPRPPLTLGDLWPFLLFALLLIAMLLIVGSR
jgi:hypothetical protein